MGLFIKLSESGLRTSVFLCFDPINLYYHLFLYTVSLI